MCWLNSWVGQNCRGPLSCISYLEKDSKDRRLKGLYKESLKALEKDCWRKFALKFRINQNGVCSSDQCICSSEHETEPHSLERMVGPLERTLLQSLTKIRNFFLIVPKLLVLILNKLGNLKHVPRAI